MGSQHLRIALAGVAFVLVGALLGGCGGGDGLSKPAAETPAAAVSGAAGAQPATSASEPEPTKAAGREGRPASKPRPERGEPDAGGNEGPRQEGDRSGGTRQGRPLEKLNELVEGRLKQGSREETRSLRRLAEEALTDPGAGTSTPDRSLNERAESILEDD